jgi:hypothetical protein
MGCDGVDDLEGAQSQNLSGRTQDHAGHEVGALVLHKTMENSISTETNTSARGPTIGLHKY